MVVATETAAAAAAETEVAAAETAEAGAVTTDPRRFGVLWDGCQP